MKFVRLTLVNIRSYTKQQVTFPDGIVLLAGDIGAGKSTILLAIEFALFGILRGPLSPSVLLRHGCQTGLVELTFTVQDKEYTVRRVLKRSQDTIEQESGCLIVDGIKKDGAATELKAWILDVLGYPLELINKTKSLVYRYTVYTPQEDMKRILFDGIEARLSVLRKVFDIDKYKHVSENAQTYARTLRERCRLMEGKISDLDVKCAKFEAQKKEIDALQESVLSAQAALESVQKEYAVKQQDVKKHEAAALALLQTKQEFTIQKNAIVLHSKVVDDGNRDIQKLHEQITQLESELSVPKTETTVDYEQLKKLSTETEQKYYAVSQEVAKLTAIQGEHFSVQQKIAALDLCPLCRQNVSHEHKKSIISQKQAQLQTIKTDVARLSGEQQLLEQSLREHKAQLERLIEFQKQQQAVMVKEKLLQERRSQKRLIEKKIQEHNTQLFHLRNSSAALEDEIKTQSVDQAYELAKKSFMAIQEKLNEHKIALGRFVAKQDFIAAQQTELAQEIEEKKAAKIKKELIDKKQQWLSDHFALLMDMMERAIFAKVWTEFNSYFMQWFGMLIEDESITARLDDTCSPVIEQNGYETTVENLSGGEKTACALAYRLALNKVINDVMVSMRTKDVLILDEPTDGFSTEQLDRLKDVLDALHAKQVIIVSHEKKVEGFADHIIRVTKSGHISCVEAV